MLIIQKISKAWYLKIIEKSLTAQGLTCNRGDIKKAYTNLAFIGKLFKTASNALGLKRKYEKRGEGE